MALSALFGNVDDLVVIGDLERGVPQCHGMVVGHEK